MAKNKEYRKLPGRGGVRKSCRVWLAADHLLMIFSTMFNQEFKRFYLRDIQAITVRKTNTAFIWTGACLTFAGFFVLLSFGLKDTVGVWVLRSIAGFFLLCAALNAIGGGSCIAEIKTAVSTEELSSLKRLRHARKTLAILRPLIDEAQGKMTSEQLVSETSAAWQRANQNPLAPSIVSTAQFPAAPLKSCSGRVHQSVFFLLLISGTLAALLIYFHPVVLIVLASLFDLALAAVAITALIQQQGSDVTPGLRRLTWIAGGYIGLSYLVSIAVGFGLAIAEPTNNNQWKMLERIAEFNPLETPWLLALLIFNLICSLGLGIIGINLNKKFRDQKKAAVPPPPLPVIPATPH